MICRFVIRMPESRRLPDDGGVRTPHRRRVLVALASVVVAGLAVTVLAPLVARHDDDATVRLAAPAQVGRPALAVPHGAAGRALSAVKTTPTPTVDPSQRAQRSVESTIVAGRLLFVGASYSIGLGATSPGAAYPTLLADRLHRSLTVDAISGTGFQNPGRHHGGTFLERIGLIPTAPAPRIVIIQGGRDDTRFPIDREYGAVLETIEAAQHRFQQAQVVVLGPIPAFLPVSTSVVAVNDAIARACHAAHAGYVNAVAAGWMTTENVHRYAGAVRGHPNDAGYAYIAAKLLAALPAALQASQPPLHGPALPTDTT